MPPCVGEVYVHRSIVRPGFLRSPSWAPAQKEILKLFAWGVTYDEIGEIRNTSRLTVRNAVSGIQKKLGFKTRQQMVVWAVRTGLVE